MMKLLWIVAGVALAAGSAVSAQDGEDAAKADKVVCKTKKVTGSRTKVKRTCMTKSEWDQLAQDTRTGVNALDRDANQKEALRRGDAGAGGAVAGGMGPG